MKLTQEELETHDYSKFLDMPLEILRNCLSGPWTFSIFGEVLKDAKLPIIFATESNDSEAETRILDEEFNTVQDKVSSLSIR